jgi:hypothetical protein
MPHARRTAILQRTTTGAAVTTPAFQAPGQPEPAQPAHKPARRRNRPPSPNVGDCPTCGGTELAMVGRSLAPHPERRIRRGANGLVEEYDADAQCPGSHGPAEEGTVHRAETPAAPAGGTS